MKHMETTPTVDASDDFTSAPIDLGDSDSYSVFALFSGSDIAGTFHLEVSGDGTNWVDLSGGSASVTSSGEVMLNISDASYRYVRYDWNYSSGTGNITVTVTVKTHRRQGLR